MRRKTERELKKMLGRYPTEEESNLYENVDRERYTIETSDFGKSLTVKAVLKNPMRQIIDSINVKKLTKL